MSRSHQDETRLTEAIRALPKAIQPARDLWPGIEGRLPERSARQSPAASTSPGWHRQALAAAVVLAFAAGILLGRQSGQEPGVAPVAAPNLALRVAMQATEKEYQAAFRQFIPVGTARGLLETQAIQSIEQSWQEMQQAEAALFAALEQHPDNTYLNQRLLDLRAQQLGFMQQLATLDRFSRRNT